MTSGAQARTERDAAAWLAALFLADARCVAARLLPPAPAEGNAAPAGRHDVVPRLALETANGRLFHVSVVVDEPIPEGSVPDVPAWAFPGAFGDALASADPRRWVALVSGSRGRAVAASFVRDYVMRRLVMERHIEAARNGVYVPLADDEVLLDLVLDLGRLRPAFVAIADLITEVTVDPLRADDPGAAPSRLGLACGLRPAPPA